MSKKWICSTDENHVFDEPTADLFCPKCRSYGGILIETDVNKINITKKDKVRSTGSNKPVVQRKSNKLIGLSVIAVLLIIVTGIFLYLSHNQKMYLQSVNNACNSYEIAKYEDARANYTKALEYRNTDSIQRKVEMLNELIPAMSYFYEARYYEAFEGLKRASDLGCGDADYYLGELTYNGMGTVKDYRIGWAFTNKAIERGFKMAYWRIANAYQTGKGVEKDIDKADRYYLEAIEAMKKLAEAGDPEALGNLGSMYSSGSGVAKNEKIAFEYYLKSANTGYAFIQSNLASMYEYGSGTELNLDEAIAWYKKSADMGHPPSLLALGNIYLKGEGVPQDIQKGLDLIKQAADQNYSGALSKLGYLYYIGEYVNADYELSFDYTKKAVDFDNDNITAIENLAYNYKEGTGTEKNYLMAKQYYQKAIDQDESTAGDNYLKIAFLHYTGGFGLPKDENEFVKYCELAEQQGSDDAKESLGAYYNRKGMDSYSSHNYSEAKQFFVLASGKGNTSAKNNLQYLSNHNE